MPTNDPAVSAQQGDQETGRFSRLQTWAFREFRSIIGAWVFLLALLFVGVVSVVVVDFTDHAFSTDQFCMMTCHVMSSTVAKELQESKHWTTSTGVRAGCADCHVADSLPMAMIDHFIGTGELFVNLFNDFSRPGLFEPFRTLAADRERFKMLRNNSATCGHCHVMEGIKPERIRGQKQHAEAIEKSAPCIACHYNLVHKEVELSEDFQKAIAGYFDGTEAHDDETDDAEGTDDAGEEML